MNKALIAVPAAAVIGIAGLGVAAAVNTDATADEAQVVVAESQTSEEAQPSKAELKKQKEAKRVEKTAKEAGISKKDVKQYDITTSQAKQIREAKNWAQSGKVQSVRQCESGGNYATNTGNGYYGAYQFDAGTWRSVGGDRYAPYANQAPSWAQDYMAWTLWSQAGWGPWGCA